MSLSGISLLDSLRDHLAADADLTALATGGLFHGRVDNEASVSVRHLPPTAASTMTPVSVHRQRPGRQLRRWSTWSGSMSRPGTRHC